MTSPWANPPDLPADFEETESAQPQRDYAVMVNPLDYDRLLAHLKKRTQASVDKCCGRDDCGFRPEGEKLEQALMPSEEINVGFVRIHPTKDGPFAEGKITEIFPSIEKPALFDEEVEEYMNAMAMFATMGLLI